MIGPIGGGIFVMLACLAVAVVFALGFTIAICRGTRRATDTADGNLGG